MNIPTYYPKNLFTVRSNDNTVIVVKSTSEILENLFQENKIKEYNCLEVLKLL